MVNHAAPLPTPDSILEWLQEVKDPEIPVLSVVELGVIASIDIQDSGIVVELTPTFTGCPAIDIMKSEILTVLREHGAVNPSVVVSYRVPWSSDKITDKGKELLMNFGLSPPPAALLFTELDILERAICPQCKGNDTEMRSPFGSTLCRSIHYCFACSESFEQFKPL